MFHDQNTLPLFLLFTNIWLYKNYKLHLSSDFPIFQIKTGNFLKIEKNQAKTYRENLQIYLHYKMRAEHQMKTIPK